MPSRRTTVNGAAKTSLVWSIFNGMSDPVSYDLHIAWLAMKLIIADTKERPFQCTECDKAFTRK